MKKFLQIIWQGWKKFARILGRINTKIILTIFFFLILGPIALIKRFSNLFRKKNSLNTFWVKKDLASQKFDDYYRQF